MEKLFIKLQEFNSCVIESITEISDLDVASKSVLQQGLINSDKLNESSILKIQAVIDYMYEQINIGNWKDVKLFLRKTITVASFLKLLAYVKIAMNLRLAKDKEDFVSESLKIIDFGILFGCPLNGNPNLLQNCASLFSSLSPESPVAKKKYLINKEDSIVIDCGEFKQNIDVINCPSMEYFYRNHILKEQPVILCNCINHWPALTKWQDLNYLQKLAGSRTVPVELGRVYTDTDWTQKLMTIGEFIEKYIYQSSGPTGYLAQYQLFDQIPELKKDISEPEYCCFSDTEEPVNVMAWFGPKGTISALHHDPKKNLLTQIVGEKKLILFSPNDSEYLYPHSHELLNNTAQVDPKEPDLEKYPKFKKAKPLQCVLRPGQMLYIPPKWWHYVESLSISFSVSFWWN